MWSRRVSPSAPMPGRAAGGSLRRGEKACRWRSARAATTTPGTRSGPGLVVNLGAMRDVAVDDGGGDGDRAARARNTMIYNGPQPHGVAISAGRCPTVAVGGLVLGGGIGFSSRKLGLTCDHLIEADIVTADGEAPALLGEREQGPLLGPARRRRRQLRRLHALRLRDPAGRRRHDLRRRLASGRRRGRLRRVPGAIAIGSRTSSRPGSASARPGRPSGGPGGRRISILGQYFGPTAELGELLAPASGRGGRRRS